MGKAIGVYCLKANRKHRLLFAFDCSFDCYLKFWLELNAEAALLIPFRNFELCHGFTFHLALIEPQKPFPLFLDDLLQNMVNLLKEIRSICLSIKLQMGRLICPTNINSILIVFQLLFLNNKASLIQVNSFVDLLAVIFVLSRK